MESETHICDFCHNPKNLVVIGVSGGAISNPAGGPTIAYVHDDCKKKWEQEQSVSTYQTLKK